MRRTLVITSTKNWIYTADVARCRLGTMCFVLQIEIEPWWL